MYLAVHIVKHSVELTAKKGVVGFTQNADDDDVSSACAVVVADLHIPAHHIDRMRETLIKR